MCLLPVELKGARQRRTFTVLSLLVFHAVIVLQARAAPTVVIARWYGDATAAYSMILDDYGASFFGEVPVIDSTLRNRGLAVSFAVVSSWAQAADWNTARATLDYCEFVNHSWDHTADQSRNYALQFDSGQAHIERALPGRSCLFFAFPGPMQKTAERVNYLRSRRYIGCRTNADGEDVNPYSFDPFGLTNTFYRSGEPRNRPDEYVSQAIAGGGFALRSFHCVSDDPARGWEPVAIDRWREHLDFVAARVQDGTLWCAPVQDVVRYAMQRDTWSVTACHNGETSIEVTIETRAEINPSTFIENSVYDHPLTLLVTLPDGFIARHVSQSGTDLDFDELPSGVIRFNAAPFGGIVVIDSRLPARVVRRVDAPVADGQSAVPVRYYLISGARLDRENRSPRSIRVVMWSGKTGTGRAVGSF